MVATVRIDNTLANTLKHLTDTLHKKKSDVIREAIIFYAQSIEKDKKSRILSAVEKTKDVDKSEHEDFEGTFDDGI